MSADSLRQKALRSGFHLTVRRIGGALLAFIGLLYLTRVVGPEAYGIFATVMAVLGYFSTIGSQGGRIYLIRHPEEANEDFSHLVHSYMLLLGIGVGFLLSGVGWVLQAASQGYFTLGWVLTAVAPTLILMLIRSVPTALLERRLEYGRLALVGLTGQLLFYCVGIPFAWQGAGVWAIVAAHWSNELFQTIGSYLMSGYRPRWFWNRTMARDAIQESLKISAGAWAYELRRFGIPLVLLPLAGEKMVGYYALADRLIANMSFFSQAIAQLMTPVYARLQKDSKKLLEAMYLLAQAQLLGFGAFALFVMLLGKPLLPRFFGSKWDTDLVLITTGVFCVHMFLAAIFGAQAQAMYVKHKSGFMLWVNVVFIIFLFPLAWLGTWLMPAPYKSVGYAIGYLLAHMPDFLLLHYGVRRWIGKPRYGVNLLWAGGLGAALFAPFTHYWSLLGLLVFVHPASWTAIREVKDLLLEARRAKQADGEQ